MMNATVLEKKIPTLFGLLMLAVAVFATSYLVGTGIIFWGHAAPTDNPEHVRITNLSDTSFTVTYQTQAQVIGTISLSSNGNNSQTILDERDQQSGIPHMYVLHSIAVKNAKPSTTYSFSITSGTTTYQDNGKMFLVTTPAAITASPSAIKPVTGKLIDENDQIPQEAFVFITTANGQTLSTLTNKQGIYIIPLNSMRTSDLSAPILLHKNTVIQILATNGRATTQAQVFLSGASPIPTMTLSSNYNFVVNNSPIASIAASLGFPAFPQSEPSHPTPLILTPKKNEGFTDAQPQFTGKALPNQTVTIEIHSNNVITATVTSDSYGNWTYRPTSPLAPGQHIVSITTKDAAGILTTIQQSFVVYASGSQVNQSATPSATLTPTSIPTSVITPTSPVETSISPTTTSAQILSPTAKPTLPPTGSNVFIASSALGIVTTLVGIILFVITKGATL